MKQDSARKTHSIGCESPVGPLLLSGTEHAVHRIQFMTAPCMAVSLSESPAKDWPLGRAAIRQLEEYFHRHRTAFSIPIDMQGTPFQEKIWNLLQAIPYGTTCSYSELAARAGNPRAARAVGNANHANPLPIIVPCHRVIPRNGTIGNYAGGADIKKALLELEQHKCTARS